MSKEFGLYRPSKQYDAYILKDEKGKFSTVPKADVVEIEKANAQK